MVKKKTAKPAKKRNMQDAYMSLHRAVRKDVDALRDTLDTLIVWMTVSAASPITKAEAKLLLEKLPSARARRLREPTKLVIEHTFPPES